MSTAAEHETVHWALRYASLGWPVFPCKRGGKLPATANGFHDATTDPERIAWHWPQGSKLNVGAAIPDGIVVLDIDSREAMQALGALDLELPTTATQRTPRGGWHLLYALPVGVNVRQTAGEIATGVDTRTTGKGYICVAPSRVNGAGYSWETPPKPENIAEAPTWILEKLAEHTASNGSAPTVDDEIPEGQRNAELASLAGTMRRRGMSEREILAALREVNRLRCRPPLQYSEVEAIARSVSRYKPAESAGSPLEPSEGEGRSSRVWLMADLDADPALLKPPVPVLPRFAWPGRLTVLAAREKVGKSTLLGAAIAAVSKGGEFLGGRCQQGHVLIATEEPIQDCYRRLRSYEADPRMVTIMQFDGDSAAQLRLEVERLHPVLAVVDTLTSYTEARAPESGSASQWARIMRPLSRLGQEFNAAVLVAHHAPKADDKGVRDSTEIAASADMILTMAAGGGTVRIIHQRGRLLDPGEFMVKLEDGEYLLVTDYGDERIDAAVLAAVARELGLSLRGVEKAVSRRASEVRDSVARLLAAGAIEDRGIARKRAFYPLESASQDRDAPRPGGEARPVRPVNGDGTFSGMRDARGDGASPPTQRVGRTHQTHRTRGRAQGVDGIPASVTVRWSREQPSPHTAGARADGWLGVGVCRAALSTAGSVEVRWPQVRLAVRVGPQRGVAGWARRGQLGVHGHLDT